MGTRNRQPQGAKGKAENKAAGKASGAKGTKMSFTRSGRQAPFPWSRLFLLVFVGLAALAGLAAALTRSNLPSPLVRAPLADAHGALMTFGFLGTAISLERGVAFRAGSPRKPTWGFLSPLFGAVGMVMMILLMTRLIPLTTWWPALPGSLWTADMILLTAVYAVIWTRQQSVSLLIQLLGSAVGACGIGLWARGIDAAILAPSWMVFLVLTIVGERLELAHVSFVGRYVEPTLIGSSILATVAVPVQIMQPVAGYPLLGIALAALLVTMLLNDTAIKTWKAAGVTGFMGICMLLGYLWALAASFLWMTGMANRSGYWADLSIHAFALGFAMSMVIAHVCVIIPSITRRQMPYNPVLWLPLLLLHLGLFFRLLGAIQERTILWKVGDAVTATSVLVLILCVLGMNVVAGLKRKKQGRAQKEGQGQNQRRDQIQEKDLRKEALAVRKAQTAQVSHDRVRHRVTMTTSDVSRHAQSHQAFFRLAFQAVTVTILLLLAATFILAASPTLATSASAASATSSSIGSEGLAGGLGPSSGSSLSPSQGPQSQESVRPSGRTKRIRLSVGPDGMSFSPSKITVPAGDKLSLTFDNTGDQRHDLVLDNGLSTGPLTPGTSKTVDVGIISHSMEGWCSIAGHRQIGMNLTIIAVNSQGQEAGASSTGKRGSKAGSSGNSSESSSGMGTSTGDPSDVPVPTYSQLQKQAATSKPYDPALPSYTPTDSSGRVRSLTMTVTETKTTIAEGVSQTVIHYNGTSPGPILRGKAGDTFRITLVNKGSMAHSIDFHAGDDAAPDKAMKSIEPGRTLVYTFRAPRSGIWMYHCSTAPMSNHIANGMFGAVIIEPKTGWPPVDKEFVLIGSEMYLGPQAGLEDPQKVSSMTADLTAFNGRAFQYDAYPLTARIGEKVRIWVLNAGPNSPLSFHVVGTQFSTVWSEGRYLVKDGSTTGGQVLPLLPAQGGFVEMTFRTAGKYPFVNHIMSLAEKGQHGFIQVSK